MPDYENFQSRSSHVSFSKLYSTPTPITSFYFLNKDSKSKLIEEEKNKTKLPEFRDALGKGIEKEETAEI